MAAVAAARDVAAGSAARVGSSESSCLRHLDPCRTKAY